VENLKRHLSESAADKGISTVRICMCCQTCMRCCLLTGTAKGSIVFTRLRQYAPPLNTCYAGSTGVCPKTASRSVELFLDSPPLIAARGRFNHICEDVPCAL